ncbi:MAG: hypothetical protein ACOYMS_02880 [Terrimicrobiaceae bacterium]
MKSKILFLSLVIGHWSLAAAHACVGCREPGALTLAHESPTVLAGVAFSWSVVFMLAFVMLIVVGMSVFIWNTCRKLEEGRQ